MPGGDLQQLADEFGTAIGEVLDEVLNGFPGIDVTLADGSSRAQMTPRDSDDRGRWPLTEEASLAALQVNYTLTCNAKGFLTVERSKFGIWIRGPRGKWRPIVRQEYQRDNSTAPQAHVHFHGDSTELGWLLAHNGAECGDEHAFHFPIGGIRFRPTVEDFLLFLERECLWTDWRTKPSSSKRIEQTFADWEEIQAKATARHHPSIVAEALRDEGWAVTPPATS